MSNFMNDQIFQMLHVYISQERVELTQRVWRFLLSHIVLSVHQIILRQGVSYPQLIRHGITLLIIGVDGCLQIHQCLSNVIYSFKKHTCIGYIRLSLLEVCHQLCT